MTPPVATPRAPQFVVPLPEPTPAPTPVSSFNPWKVLIPAMVGLLLVFGLIYAFTRNSTPSGAATTSSGLTADPNSSPVEPVKPPTGNSEAGIPAGGTTNQSATTNQNANISPSPVENFTPADSGNTNANTNASANDNSTPAKNPALPLPSPAHSVEATPPPLPTATKAPLPKPSPVTDAPPTGNPE
jgi:hypothetical protein